MQDFKNKYLNFQVLGKAFVGLVFVGAFIQLLENAYKLTLGNYVVNENNIIKIDTFRLQGKAFYNNGGKYHSPSYAFRSTNGYSFSVDEKIYQGIIDKKEFADTFSHHDLKFIAYSDKKTAEIYIKTKMPIYINVLQLQVGSKKYITTAKINKEFKNRLIRNILISALLFLFFIIIYLRTGRIFN